ncbi:MAG: N-acetyltransferase [Melioribacteraceae bacterium]|nr:N-acetyltransferase [Melioribacteraceae bacterium]
MTIEIKEVTSKSDLKKFINFQYDLYRMNVNWVPGLKSDEWTTLDKSKNPAFEFCDAKYWIALSNNKIVGRIAGIINHRYNEKWNKKACRFGWFDFIEDPDVPEKLLDTAENWGKEQGMDEMHGPLGFTDMDGEGMLVEGYEETGTLGALYNFPYYVNFMETTKYKKDADWLEYQIDLHDEIPEKIGRISDIAIKRNNLRLFIADKPKELLPFAKDIFHLINFAYKDLYGFVELSERQIDQYVKQYFGFIKPDFVPVVFDKHNKLIAFGITMPSLSKAFQKCKGSLFPFGFIHVLRAIKKNDSADLYLTAVHPDYQDKGVNAIIINHINKTFHKHKIRWVETNPELEMNEKVRSQWRFYDARQHKRRRCYKKILN